MEATTTAIQDEIKNYIVTQFFDGDDSELTVSTKLVSTGVMDSISTMQLVQHLEETYKVEFFPQEMTPEYIDTVELLTQTISHKLAGS